MSKHDIEECEDIEKLKKICLAQRKQLITIGEILVDESKQHITSEKAISKIRDYMVKNQYEIKL